MTTLRRLRAAPLWPGRHIRRAARVLHRRVAALISIVIPQLARLGLPRFRGHLPSLFRHDERGIHESDEVVQAAQAPQVHA
jgi:hypothetical protein